MKKILLITAVIILLSVRVALQAQPTLGPPSLTSLPPTAKPPPPTDTPPLPSNTPIQPSATSTPPTPSPTPQPESDFVEGMVDIGGREIYYICTGEGSPTVILESWYAGGWHYWGQVMRKMTLHTRNCAYDRAGIGRSDPAPTPRTSLDIATDMYNFLTNAALAELYIPVGHQAGAYTTMVFADQHPQDVAGIVLVDAMKTEACQRMLSVYPEETLGEASDVTDCRNWLKDCVTAWGGKIDDLEGWDWMTSGNQVSAIKSLGDLPLVAMTDAQQSLCAPPGEFQMKEAQLLKDLDAEIAALSTNGAQVITDEGYNILEANPDAVIDAILQVIEQTRSN